jgi:hypothetical protein
MHSRRVVCLRLVIATLTVAACGAKVTPEPAATVTPLPQETSGAVTPGVSTGKVPTGFTEDGAPYRGNPDASVTLVEYSEFL